MTTTKKTTTKKPTKAELAEAVKTPEGAQPSGAPIPAAKTEEQAERDEAIRNSEEVTSIRVLIKKDETTTIPRRVFEHEFPILQTIWGEDVVERVEGSELEVKLGTDAAGEYQRLIRVYGRKGENAVRQVFPDARALASEIGIKAPKAVSVKSGIQTGPQSAQRGAGVK